MVTLLRIDSFGEEGVTCSVEIDEEEVSGGECIGCLHGDILNTINITENKDKIQLEK